MPTPGRLNSAPETLSFLSFIARWHVCAAGSTHVGVSRRPARGRNHGTPSSPRTGPRGRKSELRRPSRRRARAPCCKVFTVRTWNVEAARERGVHDDMLVFELGMHRYHFSHSTSTCVSVLTDTDTHYRITLISSACLSRTGLDKPFDR